MDYEAIKVTVENGVALVCLDQPKTLNCLVDQMVADLTDVAEKIAASDEIRAVVLTGNGKAFCAGGDLNRFMKGFTQESALDYVDKVHRAFKAWRSLKQPTIAAVNGAAVGAGLSLLLICDMSVIADTAKIQCAFINMALVPDCGLGYLLARTAGVQNAMELALTGRMIDAAEAKEIGLTRHVVPAGDVVAEAMKIAEKLAKGPAYALRMTKRLLNNGLAMDFNTFLSVEASIQAECFVTEDSMEAVTAFLEKRKPEFK